MKTARSTIIFYNGVKPNNSIKLKESEMEDEMQAYFLGAKNK